MFLSNLSIKRPVFATVMMLSARDAGHRLRTVGWPSTSCRTSRSRSSRSSPMYPGGVARDRRARGDPEDRGGGQPDRRREARRVDLARGRVAGRRRVRARGQGRPTRRRRRARRSPPSAATCPHAIEEPIIEKLDIGGHPDDVAGGPVVDAVAARPDDAGRPEDQAAAREHPRRRQGRPGRAVDARGGRRPRSRRIASRRSAWASTR